MVKKLRAAMRIGCCTAAAFDEMNAKRESITDVYLRKRTWGEWSFFICNGMYL